MIVIGMLVVTICDSKIMSEEEKEMWDCLDKLDDMYSKGLKTYDDKKVFVELCIGYTELCKRYADIATTDDKKVFVELCKRYMELCKRYADIITTQENEI